MHQRQCEQGLLEIREKHPLLPVSLLPLPTRDGAVAVDGLVERPLDHRRRDARFRHLHLAREVGPVGNPPRVRGHPRVVARRPHRTWQADDSEEVLHERLGGIGRTVLLVARICFLA